MVPVKLSPDSSIRLPDDVRDALGIAPGDFLSISLSGRSVILKRVDEEDDDIDDASWLRMVETTLDEWNSPENDEAWAYLNR